MKFTTSILVLSLAAGSAMAQSVMMPINKAREAAAVSSAKAQESNKLLNAQPQATATPANAPAKQAPFTPKTAAKPQPAALNATTAAKPARVASATAAATPPAVAPEIKKPAANARDPFVSIIRNPDKTGGAPCVSGKKCLVIGEIVLRGIVKSPNAIIAVVENPQKKTYFLRENDPVFNGNVVKITTDAVVFREQIIDRAGHSSSRDITKQLNARPIA
jgi:hypothetical protein